MLFTCLLLLKVIHTKNTEKYKEVNYHTYIRFLESTVLQLKVLHAKVGLSIFNYGSFPMGKKKLARSQILSMNLKYINNSLNLRT